MEFLDLSKDRLSLDFFQIIHWHLSHTDFADNLLFTAYGLTLVFRGRGKGLPRLVTFRYSVIS